MGTLPSLMRVASVHHNIDPVQPALEEALIGLEHQRAQHDTRRVREHAIPRDDGIALDTTRTRHGKHSVCYFLADRRSCPITSRRVKTVYSRRIPACTRPRKRLSWPGVERSML